MVDVAWCCDVLSADCPGVRLDMPPDRDPIIWEHGRRNHALRLEKVLAVVGPIPDDSHLVGLYIFDRTPGEVDEIMRGDPAVQASVFVFEVHPLVGFPGDALP